MKKVCVLKGLFTEEQVAELREAVPGADLVVTAKDDMETLKDAQGVIGKFAPAMLAECPELSWVHLTSSGADGYVKCGISDQVTITTATGAYGIGIAEYMVAMLLNMMKKVPAYLENQKRGTWKDEGIVTTPMGKRVLVVGTGNLGLEFAKRMRVFGCTMVGIRRRPGECPDAFDEMKGMDSLTQEVAKADVIALCLPGTDATRHMFNEEMLLKCKEGAYLMNVGRGNVIPLEAMTKREVTDHFAGIWLDVTETEPLPDGHPLFSVPNMLITPHITGGFHLDLTCNQVFEIAKHNLCAWMGNGTFRSVLDRSTGYCK